MISCLFLCGCLLCCGRTFPRRSILISFEMEDQFRNSHSHTDFQDRVLVVIGSDRKGAPVAENWGNALSHTLQPEKDAGKLNLIGLSNLKGVPFFLKGYVRGKFPQNVRNWALLDWQGLFADSYGFIAGNANILVFDKEGVLFHQAHFSECRPDQVQSLAALIRSMLDGPPSVLGQNLTLAVACIFVILSFNGINSFTYFRERLHESDSNLSRNLAIIWHLRHRL
jgi:hypothetical protein